MRAALAAWLLSVVSLYGTLAGAQGLDELRLQAEYAVDGMPRGNLSGLARCQGQWWAVSDRDDQVVYRLQPGAPAWQAQAQVFEPPPVPASPLPWDLRARSWAASYVRGGALDYEGVSCDAQGNLYLVSEAQAAVLKVPVAGLPHWANIDPAAVREARARGLLHVFNALFEGVAIDPDGTQLWLAAERRQRGLLRLVRREGAWRCDGACVLLSEEGPKVKLARQPDAPPAAGDFADLSLYRGKLFTLERNIYRVCRRDAQTAEVERCWSFAREGLLPARRYAVPYGLAEALVIADDGAWIGLDNNEDKRADGEDRPLIWHFAAPADGWMAAP